MTNALRNWKPAPVAHLVFHEMNDELLIYDTANNKAHCLNQSMWSVWKLCNGKNNVQNILQSLQSSSEKTWNMVSLGLALKQLSSKRLLKSGMPASSGLKGLSRRDVMRRIGSGVLISIPVIASIALPTAAEAASCFNVAHLCSSNSQCCSGHCGISGVSLVCLP